MYLSNFPSYLPFLTLDLYSLPFHIPFCLPQFSTPLPFPSSLLLLYLLPIALSPTPLPLLASGFERRRESQAGEGQRAKVTSFPTLYGGRERREEGKKGRRREKDKDWKYESSKLIFMLFFVI